MSDFTFEVKRNPDGSGYIYVFVYLFGNQIAKYWRYEADETDEEIIDWAKWRIGYELKKVFESD